MAETGKLKAPKKEVERVDSEGLELFVSSNIPPVHMSLSSEAATYKDRPKKLLINRS